MHDPDTSGDRAVQRRRMVEEQIRARGVRDRRVLDALLAVPRECFVPENVREAAYEDHALPIGFAQTISQPYIVAYMTERLEITPESRILEVGTGTGYQTAILASLGREVFTIERVDSLHRRASATLKALGYLNVTASAGDGSVGWSAFAPYDRIIVTAAGPRVPPSLIEQLVDHGRLVLPVGGPTDQTIVCVVRDGPRIIETPTIGCRFVKLFGEDAWAMDPNVDPDIE